MPGVSEVSERTRQRIDDEMRRIVGEAHDEAVQLLADNRERLDSLAEALFEAETLEGPEAYAAAGLSTARRRTPTAEPATLVAPLGGSRCCRSPTDSTRDGSRSSTSR